MSKRQSSKRTNQGSSKSVAHEYTMLTGPCSTCVPERNSSEPTATGSKPLRELRGLIANQVSVGELSNVDIAFKLSTHVDTLKDELAAALAVVGTDTNEESGERIERLDKKTASSLTNGIPNKLPELLRELEWFEKFTREIEAAANYALYTIRPSQESERKNRPLISPFCCEICGEWKTKNGRVVSAQIITDFGTTMWSLPRPDGLKAPTTEIVQANIDAFKDDTKTGDYLSAQAANPWSETSHNAADPIGIDVQSSDSGLAGTYTAQAGDPGIGVLIIIKTEFDSDSKDLWEIQSTAAESLSDMFEA